MNIQAHIELHKKGQVTFLKIGYPQHICANDDDYIEYINYCWEFIAGAHGCISGLCFYDADSNLKLDLISNEVKRAHGIIEKCHKFLQRDADYLTKWFPNVYTGKLSQRKR